MNALTSPARDDSAQRLDHLAELSERLLAMARSRGASQAEVSCSEDFGLSVNVRMGEVETVESTQDRAIGVTVYFGQRKGSASTGDLREESLAATVEQACAIARYTEDDPAAGLADPQRMARDFPDLGGWHPWQLDADAAVDLALACEAAGRDADVRVRNSDGASVSSSHGLSVYANSHGFVGRERGTHHSISCALIAGTGEGMQRDGWYSTALARERQTLAFYMGVGQLDLLTRRLLHHGRSAQTPFALIENGSRPEQRVVSGTLEELPRLAATHGIQSPALLIVGEVAGLAPKLQWFGQHIDGRAQQLAA